LIPRLVGVLSVVIVGMEWETVSKKTTKGKNKQKAHRNQTNIHVKNKLNIENSISIALLLKSPPENEPIQTYIDRIELIRVQLSTSLYFKHFIYELETTLLSSHEGNEIADGKTCEPVLLEIIALGVGNIISSRTSMLQFALLLSFRDHISSLHEKDRFLLHKVAIFDPVMTSTEILLCGYYTLCHITENKKGEYRSFAWDTTNITTTTSEQLSSSRRTVFFAPHCPYRLYCNLLWANADLLDTVLIIGNR
jgi:hypothetical protein